MNILVTGANGFIGRHLVRALHGAGHACHALARDTARVPEALRPLATWHAIDLTRDDIPEALFAQGLDAVIHLATPRDRSAPLAHAVRINVDATARLIEQATRHGVPHLVHLSTGSVYQPAVDVQATLDEHAARVDAPAAPYPLTRRWAEDVVETARGALGALTVLRASTVYGAGQREDAHLAQMAESLVAGSQIYLSGEQGHRLTPLYVDDLVAVIAWALDARPDDTFNVAGPEHLFEAELARRLAEHHHTVLAFVDLPEQTAISVALDTARLDRAFPNRPRTPLARGLALTFPDA